MVKSSPKPLPHSKIPFSQFFRAGSQATAMSCWKRSRRDFEEFPVDLESDSELGLVAVCEHVFREATRSSALFGLPSNMGSKSKSSKAHWARAKPIRGFVHGVKRLSLQCFRSRAAQSRWWWGGRTGASCFSLAQSIFFQLGLCHPGWEAEQEGTDSQTSDSEAGTGEGWSQLQGSRPADYEESTLGESSSQLRELTPRGGSDWPSQSLGSLLRDVGMIFRQDHSLSSPWVCALHSLRHHPGQPRLCDSLIINDFSWGKNCISWGKYSRYNRK